MTDFPQARRTDVVVNELETEILVYNFKNNKAYCLNQTSAMIWRLCDGTKTIAEISKTLSGILNEPITDELIWLALDNFKKENLLEQSEQFEVNFGGSNRRQIVKKVCTASMVLLPVVASLVTPTAAHGASRAALFAACTSPSDCTSNFCTQGPPRCCVPGTAGIRNANVCCNGTTANCNPMCCSNTGTISPNPNPSPGCGFLIACPNS